MGGNDNPENLIRLSVEQHAIAHKELYEIFGKPEDYIAWKALSGQISISEASTLAHALGSKRGGDSNVQDKTGFCGRSKEQMSANGKLGAKIALSNPNHPFNNSTQQMIFGKKGRANKHKNIAQSEINLKISKSMKGKYKKETGSTNAGWITRELGVKMSSKNNSNQTCPHCNKRGQYRAMKRWHFDNCKQK
jgi:hypothetical protein